MKELQLKKLEAYGFKSFADKLDLEFNDGITAIVGPNGSGKSNITDAVRWVLGEQNIRNLRAAKAEDIIFSGSRSRRALGVAEVSLLFDNRDGTLPVDFQEVHITRRIFRSGESEYYINKAQCRLKDIHNLFADTGLGRDAMSVISQNKIDQILNSRPEERRMFFEEAAGITKYRNRKRESLKKLGDTEQNLVRVADILAELQSRLEPLAASAEKTKVFHAYQEKLQRYHITLLYNDYEKYAGFLQEADAKKILLQQEQERFVIETTLKETEITQLNNELLEVEKSLQLLAAKTNEMQTSYEKQHGDLLIFKERQQQGKRENIQLQGMLEQVAQRRKTAEEKQAHYVAERKKLENERAALTAKAQVAQAKENGVVSQIVQSEAKLAALKQQSMDQWTSLLQEKNRLRFFEEDLKRSQADLLVWTEKQEGEKGFEQQALFHQRFLSVQRTKLAELLSLAEQKEKEYVKQHFELDGELKRLQLVTNQLSEKISKVQSKKAVLASMQREYEGFGRAVKGVLKSKAAWRSGICGAVAELIHPPERYITALEVALGASMQHIITEDAEHAKKAIDFLKKEKLGRATFLPLEHLMGFTVRKPPDSVVQTPGYIGLAHELVSHEARYKKAAEFLLSRTLVVTNLEVALKIAKQQNYKWRIVTLSGELLTPGGAMSGGSQARSDMSYFNRGNEIGNLQKECMVLETSKQEYLQEQQILDRRFEDLKCKRQNNFSKLQAYQEKRHKIEMYEEKNALELLEIQERILAGEKKVQALQVAAEQYQESMRSQEKIIQRLESKQDSGRIGNARLEEALALLKEELKAVQSENTEIKIAVRAIWQELSVRSTLLAETDQTIELCNQETAELKTRCRALAEDMRLLGEKIKIAEKTMERLQEFRAAAQRDHSNFYQVKLEKLSRVQEFDNELKVLRKKSNDLQEQVHQADLFFSKYAYEAEHCLQKLQEGYHLSKEEAAPLRLTEESAAIRARIQEYEQKIAALGSINPNAIEEYTALFQRCDFLEKQSQDLMTAREYLSGIIKEMDDTMSKQFKMAFEKIDLYFAEICLRLFGGGQAKLELLQPENLLESGIEIHVQPPEKKMQNLTLLSGGERALTVIALLFAFLKYRPAPFVVVDEIDAALDEANLGRFGGFLKEYASHTQFIVVTHRKTTMQVADIMHGVTVEDAGVSRLVSVKLESRAAFDETNQQV